MARTQRLTVQLNHRRLGKKPNYIQRIFLPTKYWVCCISPTNEKTQIKKLESNQKYFEYSKIVFTTVSPLSAGNRKR